ncbi:MAG: hypothetical protein ACLFTK_02635 [Anaerolineales bacterium]
MSDIKNFTPIDVALLRRAALDGLFLDIGEQIEAVHPLESAMLGAVGLTGRGRPTYILRTPTHNHIAQLRLDDTYAQITLISPAPNPHQADYAWLSLVDYLVYQAGRRGAHIIAVEVPIDHYCVSVFRSSHFSVYSRERLFRRDPKAPLTLPHQHEALMLRPTEDSDTFRLNALYTSLVPHLIQQVSPPLNGRWQGYTILLEGRVQGVLSTICAKGTVLVQPYLHPELYDLVPYVLGQLLYTLPNTQIFVRIHAYQEWLRHTLEHDAGFVEHGRYVLMARHTVVHKHQPAFSAKSVLENMALSPNIEVALEYRQEDRV